MRSKKIGTMHDMVSGVTAINSWGDAPGYFISPLWGFWGIGFI